MASEKDPNELLPFCMRCFNVGFTWSATSSFCHMCGSEDTCVELKRSDIEYMRDNINNRLESACTSMVRVDDVIRYLTECKAKIEHNTTISLAPIVTAAIVHVLGTIIEVMKECKQGKPLLYTKGDDQLCI